MDIAILSDGAIGPDAPAPITVRIDPAVETSDVPFATCTTGVDLAVCSPFLQRLSDEVGARSVSLQFMRPGAFGSTLLQLEIVAPPDAPAFARVFLFTEPDVSGDEVACFDATSSSFPAQTGVLTLNQLTLEDSASIHGVLELTLEGRGDLRLGF